MSERAKKLQLRLVLARQRARERRAAEYENRVREILDTARLARFRGFIERGEIPR